MVPARPASYGARTAPEPPRAQPAVSQSQRRPRVAGLPRQPLATPRCQAVAALDAGSLAPRPRTMTFLCQNLDRQPWVALVDEHGRRLAGIRGKRGVAADSADGRPLG